MTPQSRKNAFIDPVCGMSVNPASAAAKTSHNGVEIYFCAKGCKRSFEANPGKFATQKKGFWRRYLDRLNKATGGQPPSCCH
jgi:YHS domain-containing protein